MLQESRQSSLGLSWLCPSPVFTAFGSAIEEPFPLALDSHCLEREEMLRAPCCLAGWYLCSGSPLSSCS